MNQTWFTRTYWSNNENNFSFPNFEIYILEFEIIIHRFLTFFIFRFHFCFLLSVLFFLYEVFIFWNIQIFFLLFLLVLFFLFSFLFLLFFCNNLIKLLNTRVIIPELSIFNFYITFIKFIEFFILHLNFLDF